MELRRAFLFDLMKDTVVNPPKGVARLLALNPPLQARWIGLGIVMALSAVLATLSQMMLAVATDDQITVAPAPVAMVLVQGILLVYGAWAMAFFGRRFGGTGQFADALLLVVWMEFVLIIGQAVQLVLMVLFPLSALVLTIALVGLMFWLLVRFTAALHGFTNLALVAFGVLVVFVGSALIFGVVLISIGVMPAPVT
jgi:hypothetical protein